MQLGLDFGKYCWQRLTYKQTKLLTKLQLFFVVVKIFLAHIRCYIERYVSIRLLFSARLQQFWSISFLLSSTETRFPEKIHLLGSVGGKVLTRLFKLHQSQGLIGEENTHKEPKLGQSGIEYF